MTQEKITQLLNKIKPNERHLIVWSLSGELERNLDFLRGADEISDSDINRMVRWDHQILARKRKQKLGEIKVAYGELKPLLTEAASFFEEKGDFNRSAQLYERANQFETATQRYVKAENFINAGWAAKKAGNVLNAVEYFAKAKDFSEAAKVAEEAGLYDKAAENHLRDADLCVEFSPIHSLYVGRAGIAAEKAGNFQLAIKCYADSGNEKAVERVAEEQGLVSLAMNTYVKKKNFSTAGKFAEMSSLDNLAIKYYEKAEEPVKAGFVAERQGDLESAARYFAQVDKGYPVLDFIRRTGEDELGERCLVEADGLFWAGHVAEINGRYDNAVDYYTKIDNLEKAAEAAKKSGNQEKANLLGERAIIKQLEEGCFNPIDGLPSALEHVEMSLEREVIYTKVCDLVELPYINSV